MTFSLLEVEYKPKSDNLSIVFWQFILTMALSLVHSLCRWGARDLWHGAHCSVFCLISWHCTTGVNKPWPRWPRLYFDLLWNQSPAEQNCWFKTNLTNEVWQLSLVMQWFHYMCTVPCCTVLSCVTLPWHSCGVSVDLRGWSASRLHIRAFECQQSVKAWGL